MPYDATGAAPEIQDLHRLVDLDTAAAQHVEDRLRCASTIGQEFLDAGRSLYEEHQVPGWQGQAVRCPFHAVDRIEHGQACTLLQLTGHLLETLGDDVRLGVRSNDPKNSFGDFLE